MQKTERTTKELLEKDNIEMLDQGSKAIFDGPFTLPC